MFRLISHSSSIPGGFYYRFLFVDGVETPFYGKANTANAHTFGADVIPSSTAATLLAFRKANKLPRASYGEALADVETYCCTRLGNNPRFVYDDANVAGDLAGSYQKNRCGGCGARIG